MDCGDRHSADVRRREQMAAMRERLALSQTQALTDGLTGVWNRRGFEQLFKSPLERVQQSQKSLRRRRSNTRANVRITRQTVCMLTASARRFPSQASHSPVQKTHHENRKIFSSTEVK
ncbi:MAG: hypothetical protein HZB51_02155 [Chloroflexi bacterium]|nr:hypothetical protein [Chloroflexota bacterium]